jgi:hypothetical protein
MNFTPTAPTRLIFVDSANRDANLYPTGSNYVLHLTRPVRNIERVELVSARVCNSMYNLVNGSNVLSVGTGGPSSNVSMNPGFYSVYTLANDISTLQPTVTLTYVPEEGHFLFSSSTSFTIKINSQELATMLGLARGQTLTSALAGPTDPAYTGKYIIRSSTLVDLSLNDIVYLDIEELRSPFNVDTGAIQPTTGTISGSNANRAFAPITMDVGSGCIKNFAENKDYRIGVDYPEPINSLQRLTVNWIDRNGNLLDFRGWNTNSFVLRLYLTPDPEPTLPPPPPLEDTQIRRIVQAMTMVPKPPKEEPKKRFHWWMIVLVLLGLIIAWKTWSRHQAQPMQVPRGPMVAGPVQGFQSLR